MKTRFPTQESELHRQTKEISKSLLSTMTGIQRSRLNRLINGTYCMTLAEAHILSKYLATDLLDPELAQACYNEANHV